MGKIDQAIALLKDTMAPPTLLSSTSTSTTTTTAAAAASAVTGVTNGSGSDKKGDDEGDQVVIDEDDDDDDGDSDEEEDEDEDDDDEEEKSDSDSDDDRYSKIKHKQTLINKLSQMRKMQAKQKKTALAPPPVQVISERLKPFQVQIDALNSVKTTIGLAAESLKKKEFRWEVRVCFLLFSSSTVWGCLLMTSSAILHYLQFTFIPFSLPSLLHPPCLPELLLSFLFPSSNPHSSPLLLLSS
jgi:hypothetical protein